MIARPRFLAFAALTAAAVALLLVLVTSGGDDARRVRLELPTTGGLREGSDVRIAGATIGKVDSLELGPNDVVEVSLELKPGDPGIGPNATAAVKANNLLGEKYVQLTRGGAPVPAGRVVTIPTSRVRFPVDLDEVLNVLDAPTRARLAILINETGMALTGRRVDFNRMLAVAPRSVDRATALLTSLNTDNAALGRLVEETDTFLARLTPARRDLGRFVDTAGQAMETLAGRRRDLRATLDRAPATLREARSLLAELRRTAQPLGPAARLLTSTAPALTDTLAAVRPFTAAAAPTLRTATTVAPQLSRLGTEATPVVREAIAPLRSLREVGEAAPPLTGALEDGIDGLLGALEGWSRAIQGRDSVGHVFRGHLGFGPEAVTSLMRRLDPPASRRRRRSGRRPAETARPPDETPSPDSRRESTRSPSAPSGNPNSTPGDPSVEALLDFLLGP